MKKSHLLSALCASIFSFISIPSHAALIDNGGGLIYDDVLDITWWQPDTSGPGFPGAPPGTRDWESANIWARSLTIGGATEWRLPYISVAAGLGPFSGTPVDCSTASEQDCRDNELGYMFYQNLSGTFGQSILTSGDPDLALFPTLQSDIYWSVTMFEEFPLTRAWAFGFDFGDQGDSGQDNWFYSWAVHSGNIVPIPPAVWLFGTGLLGLIGIARRKKT